MVKLQFTDIYPLSTNTFLLRTYSYLSPRPCIFPHNNLLNTNTQFTWKRFGLDSVLSKEDGLCINRVHSDNDIVCQFAECDPVTQYLSKCRLSFNLEAGAYMVRYS